MATGARDDVSINTNLCFQGFSQSIFLIHRSSYHSIFWIISFFLAIVTKDFARTFVYDSYEGTGGSDVLVQEVPEKIHLVVFGGFTIS